MKTSVEILVDGGVKTTKNRLAVLDVLLQKQKPFSVLEIKDRLKNTNIVTIYRVLDLLVKSKIVSRVMVSENSVKFEYVKNHHHHLVCTSCGYIEDVQLCPVATINIKTNKNFTQILGHSLEFFGICKACDNVR
jgi:Fur family ferric uptake transcriptional regulator